MIDFDTPTRSTETTLTATDRQQIADVINGWMHRDLGQWTQLRTLFHPDGVIEVTWFEGAFGDFVDASARMGQSDFKTKHLIGTPMITARGSRAIVETNAMIVCENTRLRLGATVHNSFYDLMEKRAGQWKLLKRQSIYDMGGFNFPRAVVDIDAERAAAYPAGYAPLAYLLDASGFKVEREFATRGSALERQMRADAQAWLLSR